RGDRRTTQNRNGCCSIGSGWRRRRGALPNWHKRVRRRAPWPTPLSPSGFLGDRVMAQPALGGSVIGVAFVGSPPRATKKMVRRSIGDVNDKVDAMGRSLEETQERTRRNEKRIGEVDEKVKAADAMARSAHGEASKAHDAANAASNRIEAIDKASRR